VLNIGERIFNVKSLRDFFKPKEEVELKGHCPSCDEKVTFEYLDNQPLPDGNSQPMYSCPICQSSFLLNYINRCNLEK